jgi:hypothetical protein
MAEVGQRCTEVGRLDRKTRDVVVGESSDSAHGGMLRRGGGIWNTF